ncbi:MAG: O-antigen ligase family protein [Verrucomicrobia bacterium]|nr:O-antigen ligase family protein [Verrucomicrobiota bacterium]
MTALGTHSFYVMIMLSNFIVTLLFILIPSTERGMEATRWLATAIILGCVAANLYEWLGYGSFTRIPGRMSGYLEDPNHSPIIICLLLGVLFTLNPNFWWNMIVAGIATVGIAVTLSRSGMAVFAVMVLPYVAIHFRERARGLLIIAAVSIPLAGAGLTMLSQTSRSGIISNDDVGSRLQAIYDLDFEKIKSPERAKDLQDGWEAVSEAIIFGYGTGAGSNQWQPHNQIVSVWLDLGIFGMLLFVGAIMSLVIVSIRQRFRAFFCLIPVLLFIPCSQVLVETPVYWFAISVACHLLFPRRIVFRLLAATRLNLPNPNTSLPSASH